MKKSCNKTGLILDIHRILQLVDLRRGDVADYRPVKDMKDSLKAFLIASGDKMAYSKRPMLIFCITDRFSADSPL